jgi:hypothetical protein
MRYSTVGPKRREPLAVHSSARVSPGPGEHRSARLKLWEFSFSALVLTLCGCAGYQLGPTNGVAAGARSVQITPFVNKTLEERLSDPVTFELRKELQRDGTYKLATHGDADIILSGVLTRYDRQEVTLTSNDVLTVLDFQLRLTADVLAIERSTGKTNLHQLVTGSTLIRVGSDLNSAERQAWPLLADDLARKVTALLADGKW